jgi:hypothetical protein
MSIRPRLIYFKGCPNAEIATRRLTEAGIAFDPIVQDELPLHSPYHAFTSPTLLLGESLVFGERVAQGASGCTRDIPTAAELRVVFTRFT